MLNQWALGVALPWAGMTSCLPTCSTLSPSWVSVAGHSQETVLWTDWWVHLDQTQELVLIYKIAYTQMNDKAWTMLSSEEQKENKRLSKEERNVICTKHTHTHTHTQQTPTIGPTVWCVRVRTRVRWALHKSLIRQFLSCMISQII